MAECDNKGTGLGHKGIIFQFQEGRSLGSNGIDIFGAPEYYCVDCIIEILKNDPESIGKIERYTI